MEVGCSTDILNADAESLGERHFDHTNTEKCKQVTVFEETKCGFGDALASSSGEHVLPLTKSTLIAENLQDDFDMGERKSTSDKSNNVHKATALCSGPREICSEIAWSHTSSAWLRVKKCSNFLKSINKERFKPWKDRNVSSIKGSKNEFVSDDDLKRLILRQCLCEMLPGLAFGSICAWLMRYKSIEIREGIYVTSMSIWYTLLVLFGMCACMVAFPAGSEKWLFHCCETVMERSSSRLKAAELKAYTAVQAKQDIMAYVIHNIRVPFNAIVLGLGHLHSNINSSENMDILQLMLDCAEAMTSVLDDVTDMGEWEGGVTQLNLAEFDLFGMVKFLSWGLKDIMHQKNISLGVHIDPVSKSVLTSNNVIGDKLRVLQTLGNFLSNAVKFTPVESRLVLTIKCEELLDTDASFSMELKMMHKKISSQHKMCTLCFKSSVSKSLNSNQSMQCVHKCCNQLSFAKVLIMVKDPSVGMSIQDQIQSDAYSFLVATPVRSAAAVLGLGSSMAKGLAQQSGGYIGVLSKEEGRGFYFSLPCLLIPGNNRDVETQDLPCSKYMDVLIEGQSSLSASSSDSKKEECAESGVSKKSSTRKVLLVEDTVINRVVLRKVLHNLDLYCDEAENGQIAVDLVKQGRTYDLILMDKEMPVMDGHEATRQLRLMGVKTPIVALTGNALQSDKDLFLQAGVDDFQTKPLSRDKLVQLLARFNMQNSSM